MNSKKILSILFASASCMPSVSGMSKNKPRVGATSNRLKEGMLENSEEANSKDCEKAQSVSPFLYALGGFGLGAMASGLSSGLGVRSFKNKEIEEERTKVTNLTTDKANLEQKIETLKNEKELLEQENNKVKSKINDIKKYNFFNDKTNEEIIDMAFKLLDKTMIFDDMFDAMYDGNIGQTVKVSDVVIAPTAKFPNANEQVRYLDLLADPEAMCKLKPGDNDVKKRIAYTIRCLLGLFDLFNLEEEPDKSILNKENYKVEKALEAVPPIKPSILEPMMAGD